jgi:hypothetical protein
MSSEFTSLDLDNKETKPIQWSESDKKGNPEVGEAGKESVDSSSGERARAAIGETFKKIRSTLSKAIERVSNASEHFKSASDFTAVASDASINAFSGIYRVPNRAAEWLTDENVSLSDIIDSRYSTLKDKTTEGIEAITTEYSKAVDELSDRFGGIDIWKRSMHEGLGLSGAKKAQIEAIPEPEAIIEAIQTQEESALTPAPKENIPIPENVLPAIESVDHPVVTSSVEIDEALERIIPNYNSSVSIDSDNSDADLFISLAQIRASRIADVEANKQAQANITEQIETVTHEEIAHEEIAPEEITAETTTPTPSNNVPIPEALIGERLAAAFRARLHPETSVTPDATIATKYETPNAQGFQIIFDRINAEIESLETRAAETRDTEEEKSLKQRVEGLKYALSIQEKRLQALLELQGNLSQTVKSAELDGIGAV